MTVIRGRPQMSCWKGLASDQTGVDCSGRRRMLSLLLSQFSFMACVWKRSNSPRFKIAEYRGGSPPRSRLHRGLPRCRHQPQYTDRTRAAKPTPFCHGLQSKHWPATAPVRSTLADRQGQRTAGRQSHVPSRDHLRAGLPQPGAFYQHVRQFSRHHAGRLPRAALMWRGVG
jgi:hypothetical protein